MGTIKKGILGGFSGSVGNVVGANWKGIDYLRIKPADITNPNTTLQSTQRLKFAAVLRFLQPMTEFIRIGFKAYAVKMSAFNAAFSFNFHHALTGEYPDFGLDYTKAMVSRGNLPGAVNAACSSDEAGKVKLTWTNNAGGNMADDTDTVLALIFNPATHQAFYLLNAALRSDEEAVVSVPADFGGETVHCYISMMAIGSVLNGQVKNSISNSTYAGNIVVA
jgi:hypothetical protein